MTTTLQPDILKIACDVTDFLSAKGVWELRDEDLYDDEEESDDNKEEEEDEEDRVFVTDEEEEEEEEKAKSREERVMMKKKSRFTDFSLAELFDVSCKTNEYFLLTTVLSKADLMCMEWVKLFSTSDPVETQVNLDAILHDPSCLFLDDNFKAMLLNTFHIANMAKNKLEILSNQRRTKMYSTDEIRTDIKKIASAVRLFWIASSFYHACGFNVVKKASHEFSAQHASIDNWVLSLLDMDITIVKNYEQDFHNWYKGLFCAFEEFAHRARKDSTLADALQPMDLLDDTLYQTLKEQSELDPSKPKDREQIRKNALLFEAWKTYAFLHYIKKGFAQNFKENVYWVQWFYSGTWKYWWKKVFPFEMKLNHKPKKLTWIDWGPRYSVIFSPGRPLLISDQTADKIAFWTETLLQIDQVDPCKLTSYEPRWEDRTLVYPSTRTLPWMKKK